MLVCDERLWVEEMKTGVGERGMGMRMLGGEEGFRAS